MLLGAFSVQILEHELPCPLCLLQRMAMLGVIFGALQNVRFGPRPEFYGMSLVSAIVGFLISSRQVLLHIVPPDPGYGDAVLGLHLYTWAAIVFLVASFLIGIMLFFPAQFVPSPPTARERTAGSIVLGLAAAVAFANVVSALLECGILACPDDPTRYVWLP